MYVLLSTVSCWQWGLCTGRELTGSLEVVTQHLVGDVGAQSGEHSRNQTLLCKRLG